MNDSQLENLIALTRSDKPIQREGAFAALLNLLEPVVSRAGRCFSSIDPDDVISAGHEALMIVVEIHNPANGSVAACYAGVLRRKLVDLLTAQRLQRRGGGQQPASIHRDGDESVIAVVDPDNPLAQVDVADEAAAAWQTVTPALTPTERKVFKARARGHSYGDIAQRFKITPKAVDNHLTHARAKIARTLNEGEE